MENLRRVIIPWTFGCLDLNFRIRESDNSNVPVIDHIVKNSPAYGSGLKVGDGIVSVNGNLVRNLSQTEISMLLNSFRNSTLVLTIIPNFDTSLKDKNVKLTPISSETTPNLLGKQLFSGSLRGDKTSISKRKFTKYSRNMSDVTDNARFYHVYSRHTESSSPGKEPGSPVDSRTKLHLNRVGGLVRSQVAPAQLTKNILINKADKVATDGFDGNRQNKLTFLTCSPIPYRSSRVAPNTGKKVIDENLGTTNDLKDEVPHENCINNETVTQKEFSETTSEKTDEDVEKQKDGQINIEPAECKIMWKCMNDIDNSNPSWQNCIIAVENGMFRVKDISDAASSPTDNSPTESAPQTSPYVYNFSYFDGQHHKWEFNVKFADQEASVKWMPFFSNQPEDKEPRKYSKTSHSQILSPRVATEVLEAVQTSSSKNESAFSKSRFHNALSRVRNFTQRRIHGDHTSDFKKQQEEWLQKTEPHFYTVSENEEAKEMALNICTDHLGYLDDRVQVPHFATLPLDKWQRSASSPLIPLVVEICVKVIEKFGIHYVGIYRVSGNKLSLDALNAEFRKPLSDIDLKSDVWNDIHAVSGVLKSFLRNLPDGVFPKDYYFDILSAWRMYEKDREKRLLSIQRFLNILDSVPDHAEYKHHREILRYLSCHLNLVASKNSINKMTAKNLAVVFAPTLLRPPVETNELLMGDYRHRIELVENIINYHEWMFSPSFESACNIPPEIDEEPNLISDMQFESYGEKDVEENTVQEVNDARGLIKDIIEAVMNISPTAQPNEIDKNVYTIIELNPNKEISKQSDTSTTVHIERSENGESHAISQETVNSKEKKQSRSAFKLSALKHSKPSFSRDQLMLTNKKICALSVALITSNSHPLRSAILAEDGTLKSKAE